MVKTIAWKDNKVIMLDQSRLPIDVVYIECKDHLKVAEGIRKLWIRGAPAIGIAAAMGIALAAREIRADSREEFSEKNFETPEAILPNVPMEQGTIIIVSYCPEPEAKGAIKSAVPKYFTG